VSMGPLLDLIRGSAEHGALGLSRAVGALAAATCVSGPGGRARIRGLGFGLAASPSHVAAADGAWLVADRTAGAGKRPEHPP